MANGGKVDAHIHVLRTLCEQAESLRKVAEDLCDRLTKQMEETRTRLVHRPAASDRLKKTRNRSR